MRVLPVPVGSSMARSRAFTRLVAYSRRRSTCCGQSVSELCPVRRSSGNSFSGDSARRSGAELFLMAINLLLCGEPPTGAYWRPADEAGMSTDYP